MNERLDPEYCNWYYCEPFDGWNTSCDRGFWYDRTDIGFCPYCGRMIIFHKEMQNDNKRMD